MAGIKISALPVVASALTTDIFPAVQAGTTSQETLLQVRTLFGFDSSTGLLAMNKGGTNAALVAAIGAIPYSTASALAFLANPSVAGKVLQSGNAAAPTWSTPTYPSASGTSGQLLASDGTNIIYSTATFPVVGGAAGNVLISNGTNYVASTSLWPNTVGAAGKIVRSNGTSNAYTTATYPDVATSTGSMLYADGTNWVSSTSLWPNTVGTAGKIIRSDGTTNAYTTSTFADTYAINSILYASAANTITALAPALSSVLLSTAASTGVPAWSGALTDGQLIIGSTGATPAVASLTAGTGISITPGSGSITINATGGGLATVSIAGTTQAAAVNTQYIALNAAQTTVTLPAVYAVGDVVVLVGSTANTGGWVLTASAGDTVRVLTSTTSAGGTVTSTAQAGECIEVICDVANTSWVVRSFVSTVLTTA